jgi:hypothetical protein
LAASSFPSSRKPCGNFVEIDFHLNRLIVGPWRWVPIASVVATACKLVGLMPRIRQDEIEWADATTLMGLIAILILCALAALLFL